MQEKYNIRFSSPSSVWTPRSRTKEKISKTNAPKSLYHSHTNNNNKAVAGHLLAVSVSKNISRKHLGLISSISDALELWFPHMVGLEWYTLFKSIWARSCCRRQSASFPWVRKDSSNAKNKVCESVTRITCFCSTSRVTDCVTAGWTPLLHEAQACSSVISTEGWRDMSTLPLHQMFPVAGARGRTCSSEPITEKISALNVTYFKEKGNWLRLIKYSLKGIIVYKLWESLHLTSEQRHSLIEWTSTGLQGRPRF